MKVIDILNSPWAIKQEKLAEITEIYSTHLRGEKIDIAAVEAALGRPLNNAEFAYELRDGVAILPLVGVIAKRMNLFTRISGGVSTQIFQQNLQAALDDPQVKSILLVIDSPGGTVDGTQEAATAVFQAREQKPVIAFADGLMASAAYWIGSAAQKVFVSGDTTEVGSIGVVAQHVDYSKQDEKLGIKVTEITAGKYKRIASENAPLSDEGRAVIQEQVNHIYSVFVDEVARNRGASAETVLTEMADGRIFLGQQAVKAGLVDGVSSIPALVAMLKQESNDKLKSALALMEDYMENPTAITAEQVKAAEDAAYERGKAEGANAERNRIKAVMDNSMAGHEELVKQLAFDGKTTGPEAAQKVLDAEKQKRANKLTELREDAAKPVAHSTAPNEKPDDDSALSVEERCEKNWNANKDGVKEEYTSLKAYIAAEKAITSGRAKILGQK